MACARPARTGPAIRSISGRSPPRSTGAARAQGMPRGRRADPAARGHYAARRLAEIGGVRIPFAHGFFKEFVVDFYRHRPYRGRDQPALARATASSVARICPPSSRARARSALYCVTEVHTAGRHRPAGRRHQEVLMSDPAVRRYHAASLGRAAGDGAGRSRGAAGSSSPRSSRRSPPTSGAADGSGAASDAARRPAAAARARRARGAAPLSALCRSRRWA